MKKILAALLAVALAFSCAACGSSSSAAGSSKAASSSAAASSAASAASASSSASSFKVGVILVGDETEGYTKAHMDGIKAAAKKLGLADSQIIWKYKVPEGTECSEAAEDLVSQGCSIIFANSYGHETYMVEVAEKYPKVTFVSMTGDFAAISGLSNFKNAFTCVYESRYVSGVVAGLKLKELIDSKTLTTASQPGSFDSNGNIKIGYVGAYPYAEVVSGYTAFYLGVKSVVSNVVMEVTYTDSWFDIDKEGAAAQSLIANGCVIIGQHADSTGAPAATEKLLESGKICYSVGYNIDMRETAPKAALTSATNNWSVYYTEAIGDAMKGKDVPVDWAKGYTDSAVAITDLGTSCADGTSEAVQAIIDKIKAGTLHVFDTSSFTMSKDMITLTKSTSGVVVTTDSGNHVTSAMVDFTYYDFSSGSPVAVYKGDTKEVIEKGYFTESTIRSAPYFSLRIDGITEDKNS